MIKMTNVLARIKIKGKNFEIMVDVDKALAFKKGEVKEVREALSFDSVFTDSKKGLHAPESDLKDCFGTDDVYQAAEKIIRNGEIQLPTEYKEKEREDRIKQVIEFFSRNAVDPNSGFPYTPERMKEAIKEAGVNIDKRPVEEQIPGVLDKLRPIIPIKLETKKIKLTVPAVHTGKVYGFIKDYKEKEEWLSNGDLRAILNIPVGLIMEFYDKLNKITHGSAVTEEIKEKEE